jgi:hypothetical protein
LSSYAYFVGFSTLLLLSDPSSPCSAATNTAVCANLTFDVPVYQHGFGDFFYGGLHASGASDAS